MESLFNVIADNVTTAVNVNRTPEYPESTSHCYYLYEHSRMFYIPFLHVLVMIVGLAVNLYLVILLHCTCPKDSGRPKKVLRDVDVFFSHLGVCNIATLLTTPAWVTQTIIINGWVFGYMLCKVSKGVITFCFQYGVLLMLYINIERYMKVVHNRARSSTRRTVFRLCACLPAFSALVDICYYTVLPVPGTTNTMMCISAMHPLLRIVTFWVKMSICFVIPIVILLYCNGRIIYKIRHHIQGNVFARNLKRAQILPFLTVTLFICCWIPLITSTIYYRRHVHCEEVKYVVLNVCLGIGNMHCITSPVLYIVMRHRRRSTKDSSSSSSSSCSVQSSCVHTPLSRRTCKGSRSRSGLPQQFVTFTSNKQGDTVNTSREDGREDVQHEVLV